VGRQVRAAFKLHGDRPWPERNPLREPSRLATLALLRYARSVAKRLPDDARDRIAARRGDPTPATVPVSQLPVGYSNLLDMPIKPFAERGVRRLLRRQRREPALRSPLDRGRAGHARGGGSVGDALVV